MMIELLYIKYHQEMLRWSQKMTSDSEIAEELVQEAFLKAMLHTELFEKMNEMQGRAWLYQTVKNLFIDRKRQNSRENIVENVPESIEEQKQFAELEWESLLQMLPDVEGTLFAMRYIYGYNSKQLGGMFSMPPGTIRSKLSSARKHLREMIGGKSDVR